MVKLNLTAGKRALVIVAHPDDECIWMGGFILKHTELDWTILALTRSSDPDRAPKFKRVCKRLDAKAVHKDMDDEGNLNLDETIAVAKELIGKSVKLNRYDYIFTHGQTGEYGHEAHLAVHQAILQLLKTKSIEAKKIFYFNYKKNRRDKRPAMIAKAGSDYLLTLSKSEFDAKKKIMTDIYGFDADGIDANLVTNPEAFKIINIL